MRGVLKALALAAATLIRWQPVSSSRQFPAVELWVPTPDPSSLQPPISDIDGGAMSFRIQLDKKSVTTRSALARSQWLSSQLRCLG